MEILKSCNSKFVFTSPIKVKTFSIARILRSGVVYKEKSYVPIMVRPNVILKLKSE